MIRQYLSLIRIHHWVKNLLIFFPLLLSFSEYSDDSIINSIYVFISFCFMASGIYIFNDIQDIITDKENNRTKNRPIANGIISKNTGYILSILFIIFSLFILIIFIPKCLNYLLLYLIINILYSLYLKYVIILDILSVSLGFIIRIFAGGVASDIEQSIWTLLIVSFAAISLATGKRLGQIVINNKYVSANWNKSFLKIILIISIFITLFSYGLFSFDVDVAVRHESDMIWISFPFFIAIFLRYLNIAWKGMYLGDPTDSILKDRLLQFLSVIWSIIIFYIFIN
ncbi:MAG: Decaprenyl-phosphate phosphoribosyltransferase [Alphaproteobacteria bacterium MarineAlpha9_Bin3]|nr:MAG: Decaprenyl-phosphate phosphoribosyltransferase [Alphaproteobacteria bacterium MarineAlpha9_Bin3]